MTQAFPLQWPTGRRRTKQRKSSAFKVKPTQAFEEMMLELRRFNASNVVVSSNIPTRQDGTPYRDGLSERLREPGVAVYFSKRKRQVVLVCDTYVRPWENCRAIGKAVEAFRSMERHGADQILDQAFEGFTALPAPGDTSTEPGRAWWVVLGINQNATRVEIANAYRAQCRNAGGATLELNTAKEAGLDAALGRD